jgi:hypothetical protein
MCTWINKNPATNRATIKKINYIMTLEAPSSATHLVSVLEEFVAKAEAFLQNHYTVGSESEDVQKILKAVFNLQLDIDKDKLEQEFQLVQEKKDLLTDYCDNSWS